MKRFPIFLVVVLLSLLALLATLQFRWLGQISDGERERLQRVVQSDTERFAEDFNREIQNAYFNFQLNADDWRERNWDEFNERYKFYKEKTTYPNLIKNFYFVESGNQTVTHYNRETKAFETADWTENLEKLKPKLADDKNFQPIADEIPALLLPIHDTESKFTQILIRTSKTSIDKKTSEDVPPVELPKQYGVLVIELDAEVIKNQIFPALVTKYFSENESANFRLAVTDNQSQTVFQTGEISATDGSAKLFNLLPDNFVFFAKRDLLPKTDGEIKERKTMVFSRVESRTDHQNNQPTENRQVEIQAANDEKTRVRIFDGQSSDRSGAWTLNVQHTAGSLEQFIADTRRKNLAISFGILGLLAVSTILIFISAQRAKLFAQRQVDFVSSVSHEFRTPLAVIYSAGENLADGVAKEESQVARYGGLIKGEGRKLSKMVEQILDFAGGNSGKKKYDWRETEIAAIIENALAECQPLLDEKEFTVEKNIHENLPVITADKAALSQAIQNLIVNSVKYSNGKKHLKISANNGGGKIKITVEDSGIGIAPKDLKHIFEPFYRAKTVVDEQIHGNGLGLSLVKQTIEKHGGKISVESEIGKGSKFTIQLAVSRKQ